jgi:demethylmenaquinone methyltransferase / 2-methoxy-6-polyprenyl-1,4-benzoquinol methylase
LPFADGSFDCVFIGYGLRNFPNLEQSLREIKRVTRPGGLLVSLDFFLPANGLMRRLYLAYLYAQGAFWGLVLHGRPRVYTYIPDSLRSFVSIDDFSRRLERVGYRQVQVRRYILGGIGLHWAKSAI